MKYFFLFCLAVSIVLPSCTPDEDLIEPFLDELIIGQWGYSYYSEGSYVDDSSSYFFLPDGSGYFTDHGAWNGVWQFTYSTFENSLFIQFNGDYPSDRAFDYTFDSDNELMLWEEIEDSLPWARLERY
jgi:hypothetical protein